MNSMDSLIYVPILVSMLIFSTMADKKVGDSASISADKMHMNDTDSTKAVEFKTNGRAARGFTFLDGFQQQDSSAYQPPHVNPVQFPYDTNAMRYQSEVPAAVTEDGNQQLNFLPPFENSGMHDSRNYQPAYINSVPYGLMANRYQSGGQVAVAEDENEQMNLLHSLRNNGTLQHDVNKQQSYATFVPYEPTAVRYHSGIPNVVAEEQDRPLNFLPSFDYNGMQAGHDFKLPFFSVPPAKRFPALSSSPLGSIHSISTLPHGYTNANPLSTFFFGPLSGFSSGMVAAAAGAAAAFLYPKVSHLFSLNGIGLNFRDGRVADDLFQSLNSVLGQFNIDGVSCMKVAFCSLGKAKKLQKSQARHSSEGSTYADVLADIMNLSPVKKFLKKRSLTQAQNFGESGGDCEYFNTQKRCPIGAETFKKYLSNLL